MIGVIKKRTVKGFGFISAPDNEQDVFFHMNSLVGVSFDELQEGDFVTFETELVPSPEATHDTIRNAELLLPYAEQQIAVPVSSMAIEVQEKINTDFIVRLSRSPQDLYQLSSGDFEELIAELYRIDGYEVELLGSWNQSDGGVDLLAMKCDIGANQFRMAIQCKRYARTNLVSAAPIRALAGVLDRFHAHAGAIVTTSGFTKPAVKEAASYFWRLSLQDFQDIVDMLRKAEMLVAPTPTFPAERPVPARKHILYLSAINVQRV